MDRIFVVEQGYANALADHSAQSYLAALRMFCPRYLDRFVIYDGSEDMLLPSGMGETVIPVGTIGHVMECLRIQRDAGVYGNPGAIDTAMSPIEVPDALMPYVGREYHRMLGRDIPDRMLDGRRWFVKDATTLKRWNSALHDFGTLGHLIDGETEYVVSERVSFVSEWRLFVHEDEPIACQNYLGDVLVFPDASAIRAMTSAYAKSPHPRSYTLDLGVMSDGSTSHTVPIEVHPFVSCGLYGMFDMLIPDMLEGGYQWYLHQ